MAGNIPGSGGSNLPGVSTDIVTQSRGASIPGGIRIAAIIGEGAKSEVVVASAVGGGADGFDSTYTSTNGQDGRHFILSSFPIISNRTSLFKNGVPLVGTEEPISGTTFSNLFDFRLDTDTGELELQSAYILNQGGDDIVTSASNVGDGYIVPASLDLLDTNAPTETWTIKCVSVQRDPSNDPIGNTAKFIAFGSISGQQLDANGNPVLWVANESTSDNGILEFSVSDGSTPFVEGDSFVIKVKSGVLNRNDSLTVSYIPEANLNDPEFLETMEAITKKHGTVSLDNNLSLGCQLAFANGTPGIMCVQAAPAMPRRTSYVLSDGVRADSEDNDDFIFPLPAGVQPNLDASIHFFVENPTTSVETQVLPNKVDYYTLDADGQPSTTDFIMDDTLAPAGSSYAYTVVSIAATMLSGLDGYIARQTTGGGLYGVFSSAQEFDSSHVGATLKIIDATNVGNNGEFEITSVTGGDLKFNVTTMPDFVSATGVDFELVDPATGLAVDDSSGVDGVLVNQAGTGTATFASASIDFTALSAVGLRLRIGGDADNNGLYDITSVSGGDTLTIAKVFVEEEDLRFEIVDSDESHASFYIVLNHNVVPDDYLLRVNIVDERDSAFYDAGWLNALESLETQEIDIIAPLPKQTMSAIFQNVLNHCKTMSNIKNKKERVEFCGAINGLIPANLTGAADAAVEDIGTLEGIQGDTATEVLAGTVEDLANYSVADAFGSTYRCVYFYPDQIVVQAGADNVLVDGFYLAAAAAGYCSGVGNVAIPLTNKVLAGFTILRTKQFSSLVMEQLVAAGVTVVQPVAGGGRVIWGLTTTQSGFPEEQEISIVFIRDRIAKSLRGAFAGFIGIAEDDTIIPTLSARAISTLNSFLAQGLITAFRDIKVARDTVDPRQWNISVRVQPTYPVNFIYIRVGLGVL